LCEATNEICSCIIFENEGFQMNRSTLMNEHNQFYVTDDECWTEFVFNLRLVQF